MQNDIEGVPPMFKLLDQPQSKNFESALNHIYVQVMLKDENIVRDKGYGVIFWPHQFILYRMMQFF